MSTNFSQWFWPRGLLLLSLGVLAAPVALWGALWLRTPWNVAIVAFIFAAFWALARGESNIPLDLPTRRALNATALWAFLPLALMCFASGIGGWGYQTGDWEKHNAVLADLVRFEWPVRYVEASAPVHLTYYTAFYLPAALMGKFFGWTAALAAHQLGSLVVMGLLSAWLAWIVGPRAKWVGLIFAAFGGLDYPAEKLLVASYGRPLHLELLPNEWWEKPMAWWAYYSHVSELFWVPHAALAGWLGAAILLRGTSPLRVAREGQSDSWNDFSFDLVTCAFLPLWSPWAWLGCLPLLAVRLRQQLLSKAGIKLWPWLFMLALWAMQFGYLMSRAPLATGVPPGRGYRPSFQALDYVSQYGARFFSSWLLFSLAEFGVFVILCLLLWRRAKVSSPLAPFLWVSTFVLALLPLFFYGFYNDLLRAAGVPLVVVSLACASALRVQGGRGLKGALIVALAIGALHSVDYAKEFLHKEKAHGVAPLRRMEKTPSIYAMFAHDQKRPQVITQYVGRDDSLWARWFLKP